MSTNTKTPIWRRHKSNHRGSVQTTPPENGLPIQVSQAEITRILHSHEGYFNSDLAPGVTVREGLLNMIDATPYGLSAADQAELWQEEIKRLSAAVTHCNTPPSFVGTKDLALDTKDAYETLANLGNQMWIAMNVIIHDSEVILANNFPDLYKEKLFKESRDYLEQFIGGDEDDESDEDNEDDKEDKDEHCPSAHDYNELVNYLTATIARVHCRAAKGKNWLENVLAVLVKMSTKLKAIFYTLKESVSLSLESRPNPNKNARSVPSWRANQRGDGGNTGHGAMGRLQGDVGGSLHALDDMLNALNVSNTQDQATHGPKTRQKAVTRDYWATATKYQFPVHLMVQHILLGLRGEKKLRTISTTSYELSAVLYDTTFSDFATYIYQDINGDYLGSSKQENINVAHAAFDALNSVMTNLTSERDSNKQSAQTQNQNSLRAETRSSTAQDRAGEKESVSTPTWEDGNGSNGSHCKLLQMVGTTVLWYYSTEGSASQRRPKELRLKSMCQVIAVMVPLLVASPRVIDMIADYINMCAFTADTSDAVSLSEAVKYKAFFTLSTEEYRKNWDGRSDLPISPLSRAIMSRDRLLLHRPGETVPIRSPTLQLTALPTSATPHNEVHDQDYQRAIQEHQQEVERTLKKMDEWVVEESGVRVRCECYVWTTLLIASTLVLGGIAAGVTIHDRLDSVDPFNITTFCWVVAAFIIVVAKSLLVAEWPWRDFLRRQVLCRSVSELHSVSGIDEQLILAKLLHDESVSRLQTRGPYNSVFSRKTDSADGFSIDQPIGMRTMLLSGLIMIQVLDYYHGEFLVCLDLRQGTDYNVLFVSNGPMREDEFIVSDPVVSKDVQQRAPRRRIPLKVKKGATWGRILGIYGQSDCSFT